MGSDNVDYFDRVGGISALTRSFGLFGKRLRLFAPLGAVQALPVVLLSLVVAGMTERTRSVGNTEEVDISPTGVIAFFCLLPIMLWLCYVGIGATTRAALEVAAQKEPTIKACLGVGCRRACAMFGYYVVYALVLAVFGFTIALAAPIMTSDDLSNTGAAIALCIVLIGYVFLMYIVVSLQITPAAIIAENKGPCAAMTRAWRLTAGKRCYVFIAVILTGMIYFVVKIAASFTGNTGYFIITTILQMVMMPVVHIMSVMFFVSFRVEKECLDLHTLQEELGFARDTEMPDVVKPVGGGAQDTTEGDDEGEDELV